MNLSERKDRDLRQRARQWFYVTGVLTGDTEDIIQNAMLKLYSWHEKWEDVDEETFADVNWKRCLNNAFVDWVRKNDSYQSMLERYADSITLYPKREEFILEARFALAVALPKLTHGELVVCLALMDNDFRQTWAAEELGVSKQYVNQALKIMRNKLTGVVEFNHNPTKGEPFPSEYDWKSTGKFEGTTWAQNDPSKVEVFNLEEFTQDDFWDRAEAEKVWPVTIIKGEDYDG
jgi:DNA-directed RNA polymerase specialized sigma24 family protein